MADQRERETVRRVMELLALECDLEAAIGALTDTVPSPKLLTEARLTSGVIATPTRVSVDAGRCVNWRVPVQGQGLRRGPTGRDPRG